MAAHKVLYKEITLKDGTDVQIKYWADTNTIYVAAFDESGNQVSVATYQAPVEFADDFFKSIQNKPLIKGLVEIIEGDLINNPNLHQKK